MRLSLSRPQSFVALAADSGVYLKILPLEAVESLGDVKHV